MKRARSTLLLFLFFIILLISGCMSNKKDNIKLENEINNSTKSPPIEPLITEQTTPEVPKATVEEPPGKEPNGNKTAYLTFDDGPSSNNTTTNLITLKKYGIKATFFVLPHKDSDIDEMYKLIIKEGHIIGNHSFTHQYSYLYGSIDNFSKDLLQAQDYIYKKSNYRPSIYRFPGGSMGINKTVIQQRVYVLKQNGYRYFDWDVTNGDTETNFKKYGNDESKIVNLFINNVLTNTKGKEKLIVLMHDDTTRGYTAKALPSIIEGLIKQEYKFDTLINY